MRPRQVHSPQYRLLTQHLKQARLQPSQGGKKMTQCEVAKRLGKIQSFVNKVEAGERELNALELVDYCEALGIDFFEFMREVLQEAKLLRNSDAPDEE